jgi:cation transporter-like permease
MKLKEPQDDLLSSLCGREAGRDRQAAEQARRVVGVSCGVLRAHHEACRRSRTVVLAAILLTLLLLGTLFGSAVYTVFEEEILAGQFGQLIVVALFLAAAVAVMVVLAGWIRRRP